MVIADFSLNLVRKSLPRTGLTKAGERHFGAAYAKQVGQRQPVVGACNGFPEPVSSRNRCESI
jgi:hypothetical protein